MTIKNFAQDGETVVLFDMDGTLTPPRKKLSPIVLPTLRVVSTQAKIGIVTGSPFEYVEQQISELWGPSGIDKSQLMLMPCNGTQVYLWNRVSDKFEIRYSTDIKDFLIKEFNSEFTGKDAYTHLVKEILELQLDFLERFDITDVSGNFVSYRGSLVNWSMIGRDADDTLRNKFELMDKEFSVRKRLRKSLRVRLDTSGFSALDCALGGATSIDIYPEGWDKTHALQHLEDADVWFWGDRCTEHGNDRAIYEALGPGSRSFETTGPTDLVKSLRANLAIDWMEGDLIEGNLERNRTVGSD